MGVCVRVTCSRVTRLTLTALKLRLLAHSTASIPKTPDALKYAMLQYLFTTTATNPQHTTLTTHPHVCLFPQAVRHRWVLALVTVCGKVMGWGVASKTGQTQSTDIASPHFFCFCFCQAPRCGAFVRMTCTLLYSTIKTLQGSRRDQETSEEGGSK